VAFFDPCRTRGPHGTDANYTEPTGLDVLIWKELRQAAEKLARQDCLGAEDSPRLESAEREYSGFLVLPGPKLQNGDNLFTMVA
jgi:hypothetical protein